MFRKCLVAAAVVIAAATFVPTAASAGGGHYGYHKHGHHGFHGGGRHFHRFGRHFHGGHHWRFRRPVFASCWRFVPSRYGYVKVWVCG
jgi:hypothetical protein